MKYAGFLPRFLALIIDSIIVSFPTMLIENKGINSFIGTIISLVYFVWMHGKYGASIGKMVMKIKVIKENGKKISYSDALVRQLASVLSLLVLCLGYLNVIWDSKKQGWHDKIAKTVVIKS